MLFEKKLLSKKETGRLINAIEAAERNTSGEIRVHIEKHSSEDAVTACEKLFYKLQMQNTKHRNGILFYLSYSSKTFAVWGDEGIHAKVKNEFWDSITNRAVEFFKKGDYITGLEQAITLCGEKLSEHFPFGEDDKNELPNQISY